MSREVVAALADRWGAIEAPDDWAALRLLARDVSPGGHVHPEELWSALRGYPVREAAALLLETWFERRTD